MKQIVLVLAMILAFSVIAAAQMQPACSIGSIQGTYLVSYQGLLTIPDPTNPYATPTLFPGVILGVMSIGPNGNISGTSTLAGLSEVAEYESIGTLTLNAGCTGVMRFTNRNKKTGYTDSEEDKFIVVAKDSDREIQAITTNVGAGIVPVMLAKWTRIAYASNAIVW